MRTERVTVLMTPAEKAALTARAAALGVSSGAVLRSSLDEDEQVTPEQEAELAALVAEVNGAVPIMRESLRRSTERIDQSRAEIDRMLREAGLRQ